MVPGSQPAPPRLMPRCLVVPQSNTVAEVPRGVLIRGWGAGPALGAHRHSGTDPRNSQRARRVAPACEVVREDHITRSKTARGAIADPDFHLPRENKNVLSPGRGVPIAPMVRRKTAEHEVGTRLKRNVVALLGRQREIFKMGLAVVARIYPYDHARAPSQRDHHARKGLLRAIADDEASGIPAPHASTGMCAENMKLIVVRTLLIDAGGTAELGESGAGQEACCAGRRAGMP